MKKKLNYLSLILLIGFTISSCKKEKIPLNNSTNNSLDMVSDNSSTITSDTLGGQILSSSSTSFNCSSGYYNSYVIPSEWNSHNGGLIYDINHYLPCNSSILRFESTDFTFDSLNGYIKSSLTNGESIYSPNGSYRLTMQSDGNLVLYTSTNNPIWRSGSVSGSGNYIFRCQSDGNMVIYKNQTLPASYNGTVVWQSSTRPNPYNGSPQNAFLYLQDDGNLVMYFPQPPYTNGPSLPIYSSKVIAYTGTSGGKKSSHNGRFRASGYTY